MQMSELVEGAMVVFEDRPDVNDVVELYKNQANLDQLTGIANRFGFYDAYTKASHSMDGDFLFAVAIIDIDDLKKVNDRRGHLIGDKFIQNTANGLSKFLREGDILARWGGDEFIVILLDVFTINHVEKLVERLVLDVHQYTRELGTPVNLSVGSALWKHDGYTLSDLIGYADKKMYEDKQRNKDSA